MRALSLRCVFALVWLSTLSPLQSAEPRRFRGKTLTEWEHQLAHPNSVMRARAATAIGLGRFGKPAVPMLLRAMHDLDSAVVGTAIQALGMLGPDAVAVIPALMKRLYSDDTEHWDDALATLKSIGPTAVPALLTLPRLRAVREGGYVRSLTVSVQGIEGPVVPPLLEALQQPHGATRLRAMEELKDLGPLARPAVPALTKFLQDDDAAIRSAALDALMSIAPTAQTVALIEDRFQREGVSIPDLHQLLRAGPAGRSLVLKTFRTGTNEWKAAVLSHVDKALDELGSELFPLLQAGLEDPDAITRYLFRRTLFTHDIDPALFRYDSRRCFTEAIYDGQVFRLGILLSQPHELRNLLPELRRSLRGERLMAMLILVRLRSLASLARPVLTAVQEACEAVDADVRRHALEALLTLAPDDPATIRTLCKALKDAEPGVRSQAARLLGKPGVSVRHRLFNEHRSSGIDRMGVEGSLVIESLRPLLTDSDMTVRVQTARSLQQLGYLERSHARFLALVVIDPLRWSTASVDRGIRFLAAEVLRDMGPAAAEVLPLLLLGLHDSDDKIYTAIIEVLQGMPAESRLALPWLRRMLLKRQGDSFALALAALGEMSVPSLREGLQKKNPALALSILEALHMKPAVTRPLLPEIISTLEIDNLKVRYTCLQLLSQRKSDDPRLIESCVRLLDNPDHDIRFEALAILGGAGTAAQAALPAVCELLVDPACNVRRKALETIARLGADDHLGVPDLIEMLACAEPEMRSKAAEALAIVLNPGKNIGDTLRKALDDPNEDVRLAVCRSLIQFGDYQTPIKPLERLLNRANGLTRIEAALLLWRLDRREAVIPTLCELLHDSNGGTAQQASNALVQLQDRTSEVRAYVRPLLSSRNFGVRRRAMAILNGHSDTKQSSPFVIVGRERMP